MESVCIDDIVCRALGGRAVCCDASPRYLVVGGATGSVWWFDRAGGGGEVSASSACGELASTKQSVLAVRVSPDETVAAFGTRSELQVVALPGGKPLLANNEMAANLTCVEFASDSKSVFQGFDDGSVVLSRGGAHTVMLKPSGEAVVQLSASPKHLLVSTPQRTSIVDLETLAVAPVGKQSVRSGLFGATYHPLLPGFFVASRPGLRLWLAEDRTGNVVRTLPFVCATSAETLGKMLVFGSNLVSVSETSLLFLELEAVKVTQVMREWPQGIRHVAVSGDACYVCCGNSSLYSVAKPRKVLLKKVSSMISSVLQQPLVSAAAPQPRPPTAAASPPAASAVPNSLLPSPSPPEPPIVFDMRFTAVAQRICARCNDAWRGVPLDAFAVSETDLGLLQAAFSDKSPKTGLFYAALLCVHALLATWLLPELPVDDFVKSFKSEILKSEKALEAVVAAWNHARDERFLDELSTPNSPLVYFRLRNGESVEQAALVCAQKFPALSDEFFLKHVADRKTRLEYLVYLLGFYPLLATPARMELLLSHCEPEAGGVWPLDELMFSFCNRCRGGELLPVCRAIRYYRGILDVDLATDMFTEQFSLAVELNDAPRAAALLQRRRGSFSAWKEAFRLCSDSPARNVNREWVAEEAVRTVRPASELARVLACSSAPLPHLAPLVASLALQEQTRAEVACALLETLDAHLWAKQNPHMLPQAAAAVGMAADSGRLAKALSWQHEVPAVLSFDEMQTHWGAKTSGACAVCHIAVGPVRVFRCGHAAHNECSPEEACSVCFSSSFKSLI